MSCVPACHTETENPADLLPPAGSLKNLQAYQYKFGPTVSVYLSFEANIQSQLVLLLLYSA